jgi:glycosyltransferase involved in cell wall biosynthesis
MDTARARPTISGGNSKPSIKASRTGTAVTFIGINYHPEPLGIAPYSTGLCSELVQRGYDVKVITGVPHYPEWRVAPQYRWTWKSVENIGEVPVTRLRHSVPRQFTTSGRLLMEATFGIRAALSQWNRPDVLICVTPALISTALLCLRFRASGPQRPALGVWVQDLYSAGLAETQIAGSAAFRAASELESWVLRQADGVAVIHDRLRSQMLDSLDVDPAKVTTIRNWSHVSSGTPFDRDADRKRLGWARDETVVLHAGNMGIKQGLDNVVRAAQLADQQNLKIRFVLLGDGNQRRSLEKLGEGVRCLQIHDPLPDNEFAAALTAADILLVNQKPGVTEMSVPSKLTSYFQSGTAVLAATDEASGAAAEIRNSGAGIVVDSGDPRLLLKAVTALAGDTPLRTRLGANGAAYVTTVLNARNSLDCFDEWIEQLCASRRH